MWREADGGKRRVRQKQETAGDTPVLLLLLVALRAAPFRLLLLSYVHRRLTPRPDPMLYILDERFLVNFDCTATWVKKSAYLVDALSITPEILMSKEYRLGQVSDFRDWQVRGWLERTLDAMYGTARNGKI